jgi:hypothetical protein
MIFHCRLSHGGSMNAGFIANNHYFGKIGSIVDGKTRL